MPDSDSCPALAVAPATSQGAANRHILSTIVFNFAGYLAAGLPLAVVPGFVLELGYGAVLAGLAVSSQYLATLLSRVYAGRLCDTRGPKRAMRLGLWLGAASGALLGLAALLADIPWLSLGVLLAARLLLGTAESLITTASITWSIGLAGAAHTGKVISWNGMTSYGGLALGAPLGVWLAGQWGVAALGLATLALLLAGLLLARRKRAVRPVPGARLPLGTVFWRMLPFGLCLALGSLGFGAISTFVALFYASRHWPHAALALSMLGVFFILGRLLLAGSIGRFGGYRVALAAFAVEALGLALLWQAGSPGMALAGAAVTGFGFALVFPSLGMEAVRRVPDGNRGSALGAYALFLDLALALTGPGAGWVAGQFGYAAVFLAAALAAVAAGGLAAGCWWRLKSPPAEFS